jgi:hypothetical protein
VISFAEIASWFAGNCGVSAKRYGGTEDVRVAAVVVAPRELGDVERKIFAADLVIAAHDATLQKAPKSVDCLRMNRAVDIFAGVLADGAMRKAFTLQLAIGPIVVCSNQADTLGNRFTDESIESCRVGMRDDAGDDIALTRRVFLFACRQESLAGSSVWKMFAGEA